MPDHNNLPYRSLADVLAGEQDEQAEEYLRRYAKMVADMDEHERDVRCQQYGALAGAFERVGLVDQAHVFEQFFERHRPTVT